MSAAFERVYVLDSEYNSGTYFQLNIVESGLRFSYFSFIFNSSIVCIRLNSNIHVHHVNIAILQVNFTLEILWRFYNESSYKKISSQPDTDYRHNPNHHRG